MNEDTATGTGAYLDGLRCDANYSFEPREPARVSITMRIVRGLNNRFRNQRIWAAGVCTTCDFADQKPHVIDGNDGGSIAARCDSFNRSTWKRAQNGADYYTFASVTETDQKPGEEAIASSCGVDFQGLFEKVIASVRRQSGGAPNPNDLYILKDIGPQRTEGK